MASPESGPERASSSTRIQRPRPWKPDTKPKRSFARWRGRKGSMPEPLRVVFVDNFDSFTWNLVDEFARRGIAVEVWRNTAPAKLVLARARQDGPGLLVLSPGPGTPAEAGSCIELVRLAAPARVPVFGVCLGHQAMVEAWGGTVGPAGEVVHGKTSRVRHEGGPLFEGVPSPFPVG